MSKALLIKSQIDKNGGEVGKWNNFNNCLLYTSDAADEL